MAKPKLIRIGRANANMTDRGLLIKVNDKMFVLVEEQKKSELDVGDRVFVKQTITGVDILRPDLTISFQGWEGRIWSAIPPDLNDFGDWSYQIRWNREAYEGMPRICQEYCKDENIILDELQFLARHLQVIEDTSEVHRSACDCCGTKMFPHEVRYESAWGENYCLDCACLPPTGAGTINRQPIFLDILAVDITDIDNEGYCETAMNNEELNIFRENLHSSGREDWSLVIEDWDTIDSILGDLDYYNAGFRKIKVTFSFGGNIGSVEFDEGDIIVVDNPLRSPSAIIDGEIVSPQYWTSADDRVASQDDIEKVQQLINSRAKKCRSQK